MCSPDLHTRGITQSPTTSTNTAVAATPGKEIRCNFQIQEELPLTHSVAMRGQTSEKASGVVDRLEIAEPSNPTAGAAALEASAPSEATKESGALGPPLTVEVFGSQDSGDVIRVASDLEQVALQQEDIMQQEEIPSVSGTSETCARALKPREKALLKPALSECPLLSAEEEAQARLIFECFDSDGSGHINVNEFAALLVKDRKVASFMGLRTSRGPVGSIHRRTRGSSAADEIFRDVCGDEHEMSFPMFKRFLASRSPDGAGSDKEADEEPHATGLVPEDEAARLVFDAIDADCSGSITCAELAAACVKRPLIAEFVRGPQRSTSGRRASADKLFQEMDVDGDRAISFQEFAAFVSSHHEES